MKWIKLGAISFILYFITVTILVGKGIQLSGPVGAVIFIIIFTIMKHILKTGDEGDQEDENK